MQWQILKPLLRLAHFFIMFLETSFLKLLWKGHISDSFNILHSWFPIKLGNKMLIIFFTGGATRVIWYTPFCTQTPWPSSPEMFTFQFLLLNFALIFFRSYLSYMIYADKILPIIFCLTGVVYNKTPKLVTIPNIFF